MNIIFQDIDGPLIPYRMYFLGDRLVNANNDPRNPGRPFLAFDPVAVAMVNTLCERLNCQVVFNSAHNNGSMEEMRFKGEVNGLKYLHPSVKTKFNDGISDRYQAIGYWLDEHQDENIENWIVFDDMYVHEPRQILVDILHGITLVDYQKAFNLLSGKDMEVLPFISLR